MDALIALASPLFAEVGTLFGAPVTWLELVAFVLAVAMVVCNIRVIPWGWPLAMVSSLLYFLLFWQHRLYGDASLQVFFATVAAWGWWQWLRGTLPDGRALVVRYLPPQGRWLALGAALVAWPVLGLFLDRYTDTDVPYWDAFPTALSVIGQVLLGRKYVENWPTWIVVNVACVSLFAYKGLWLTVVLYTLFVAMSVVGWRAWRAQAAALRPAP